jgi:tetratricopeptide (TPR) repeat protein
MIRAIRSISLILVVLVAAVANAEPPSRAARAKAEAHYRAGEDYHRRGKYQQAVAEYQAAYDLAPLPLLLFNIAQAYRLGGDKRNALSYYERYLAAEPDGRSATQASLHAEALRKAIAMEEAQRPPPEPPPPEPPPASEPVVAPAPPPPRPMPVAPPPEAERQGGGGGLRVAGLVTAGLGVAAVGGGVYFGLHARSLANEVADTYSMDKVDQGQAANRNMYICYGVGAAAIVTGGVLYWLGARAGSDAPIAVAPVVGPTTAGLEMRGRF